MTLKTDKPKCNKELESEIERLNRLLEEEKYQHQEAKETLEAIRTGAVDGIVRSSPEGEQVFILKGADQPYRNLIEEMSEGALLISGSGTILYANIGFAGLIDAPLDKVIGTHFSDWVSARNVEVLNDIILGNKENGRRVFEIAFQTTKQKLIPTQVSLSNLLFGTVNASALVVTDLTKHMEGEVKLYTSNLEKEIVQRKKAEEALAVSEAHYRTLFSSIGEGFELLELIFDENNAVCDMRYLEVNDAYEKQTGVKAKDVLGKTVKELFPTIEKRWIEVFDNVIKTGLPTRLEDYHQATNRYYSVYYFPFGKKEVGALFSDVTERKKAEEAVKESENLYRTIFENSEDGFQLVKPIFDENGNPIDYLFLKVNHAYERQVGLKAEQVVGKTVRQIVPNIEPEWIETHGQVAKTGKTLHKEIYNDFSKRWYDLYYFSYKGGQVGVLFREITARKELEKLVQDNERLAAIGQTAGMVGHDIRNPLQAITSDTYLAKTDLASTPDSEEKKNALESLDEIEKNVVYINKIVQDLQDFAKPLKPNTEETDLKRIIDDLLEKNGLPENVEVSVNTETEKVIADSTFISRIMYNLVNNAVQAMPNGGKLSIRTYKQSNDTIIVVKDTGVGIPEENKRKLFTPLFTTKSKGQGFGLAVIKRMTESLGGTVTFESQEGKGTTFTLRLPPPKS